MKKLLVITVLLSSLVITNPRNRGVAEVAILPHQPQQTPAQVDPMELVHQCGIRLLQISGKTTSSKEVQKLPPLYVRASVSKDIDFLQHMMAVIFVESRFHKDARSDKDAYGLMQMTSIAIVEATKQCNFRPIEMGGMFDSYTNIRYGSCYLRKALKDADGDWTRALVIYNGGYVALNRYDRGDDLPVETAQYVVKVNKALTDCKATVYSH